MHFDKGHCLAWRILELNIEEEEMTVKQEKAFLSLKQTSTLATRLSVSE